MGKYPKTLRDVMRAARSCGGLFGSQHFGKGEFPSLQQLRDSIYQVQTITLEDGTTTQALVATNSSGSTIISTGINYILGGSGSDVLIAGFDTLSVQDPTHTQTILGNAGADYLEGRDGRDNLFGGTGNEMINGGDDNDILQGDAGDDQLFGEAGTDTLIGGDGDDFIHAGTGDDVAASGAGRDYLLGGAGNDALSGDAGDDVIDGLMSALGAETLAQGGWLTPANDNNSYAGEWLTAANDNGVMMEKSA